MSFEFVSYFGFRASNLHFCLTLASFAPLRESSFIRFPKPKFNGKFQICLVRLFSYQHSAVTTELIADLLGIICHW